MYKNMYSILLILAMMPALSINIMIEEILYNYKGDINGEKYIDYWWIRLFGH